MVKGKVIQGLQGCDRYREERCFISAYDADTGKLAWKFHTVAHSGEPGGDTWNNLPNMMRQGGETWIAGSYDPDVDLTFWGTAQAKPWMPVSRGTRVFDAAQHTASTVALNPATGELVWRFQHLPAETLDLDEVFERVSVDIGAQKALFTIGKSGILWKLDRKTGSLLDLTETIFQIPGLGQHFISAAVNRDDNLAMATAAFYATLIVGFNLLVDIIQATLLSLIHI